MAIVYLLTTRLISMLNLEAFFSSEKMAYNSIMLVFDWYCLKEVLKVLLYRLSSCKQKYPKGQQISVLPLGSTQFVSLAGYLR